MKRFAPLIIVLSTLIGCSGNRVVSFVSPRGDFGGYHTFKMYSGTVGEKINADSSALNNEIEALIIEEMLDRNYKQNARADLRVEYSFISNKQTEYNVNPSPIYGANPFYNNIYDPYSSINARNFYEAILLIEIKDRKNGKSVWQGSLDLKYTRKIKEKKNILPQSIETIFGSYPYFAGEAEPRIVE
ncbi:MAG: DUF4136 domain-containing protein [Cyclobacteriaceae bacterium]